MPIQYNNILFDDIFLYDDETITFDGITVIPSIVSGGGAPKKRKFRYRRFIVNKLDVMGLVAIKFKELLFINGLKKLLLKIDIYVLGQKKFDLVKSYNISKTLKNVYNKELILIGTKTDRFNLTIGINASRLLNYDSIIPLSGNTRFNFSINNRIVGQKSINENINITLGGIKKFGYQNVLLTKGEKDISNILIALDLL